MLSLLNSTKALFETDSTKKTLTLEFLNSDIANVTNDKIYNQSLSIVETLCDEDSLKFGKCSASQLSIQIRDSVNALAGLQVRLTMNIEGSSENIPLGVYIIDKPTMSANLGYKKITGYDRMVLLDIDVSSWYAGLYQDSNGVSNGNTYTIKYLRESLLTFCGVTYESTTLVNDSFELAESLDSSQTISGRSIMENICEINGVFGHINRSGTFAWISISGGTSLYPALDLYPSTDLFPRDMRTLPNTKTQSSYIDCKYEDYIVHSIDSVQLVDTDGNEYLNGTLDSNVYAIKSNFCLNGLGVDDLQTMSENLLPKIAGIEYMPSETSLVGLPYVEVGDGFVVETNNGTIETVVLNRTLSGTQALRDIYTADGTEYYETATESLTETLSRLSSSTYKTKILVQRTNDSLSAEVSRATSAEGVLSSSITLTAESITAEVTRAKGAEQSIITQTADDISLKVSKANLISEINQSAEKISMSAVDINLSGYVTISDLSGSGTTTINGSNITTGTLNANLITSGTIHGNVGLWVDYGNTTVTVNSDGIYNSENTYLNDVVIYGDLYADGDKGWTGAFTSGEGYAVQVRKGIIIDAS